MMEEKEHHLLVTKGNDYACNEDRLSNFKQLAEFLGLSPLQVWAVYTFKHILAISQYVREGQVESEPIEERIADARNYLVLGLALIKERPTSSECSGPEEVGLKEAYNNLVSELAQARERIRKLEAVIDISMLMEVGDG